MTYEEFKDDIMVNVNSCPVDWREGQAVFNIIDELYGVARYVQFNKRIDCFYDNSQIENFLKASYDVIIEKENETKNEE